MIQSLFKKKDSGSSSAASVVPENSFHASPAIESSECDVVGALRPSLSHRLTADDVMLRSFNAEPTNDSDQRVISESDDEEEEEENYVALSQCASGGGHGNHRLSTRCESMNEMIQINE